MRDVKYGDIVAQMTLEDKVAFCSGGDRRATKAWERYGMPSITMTDGPHGLRKQNKAEETPGTVPAIPATCFPTGSATGCSWDRNLIREMGEAMAEEALQEDVSIILGPSANIKRNPLCGRNYEYLSEDPYLAGEMSRSVIEGMQSRGVGACLKHFAGNNQESLRYTCNSIIDERTLREIYLPAFENAVKGARPATVMCAYNLVNGVYCSDHAVLLREILRDEWGFRGVIVSDWGAVNDRVEAFKAGLDLEMPYSGGFFDSAVIEAIKSGSLPVERLDESVDRLLELAFAGTRNKRANYHYDVEAHHRLAQAIAASSAVLLKNEDRILPIPREKRVALIGSLAKEPRIQGAGSSLVTPTILSSAVDGFGAQQLRYTYYPGYDLRDATNWPLVLEAEAGARECDVAVIFAGLPAAYEGEGFDRETMGLPQCQNDLISRVAAANPNTVVVVTAGAPVEMPWLPRIKAVLGMYPSGQAGGLAVAQVLTGALNPSGKLAETWPLLYEDVPSAGFYVRGGKQAQYREAIYVGYRYYDKAAKPVAFPFGHGLSYTTFEYSDLKLSRAEIQDTDELTVSVTIKNSGGTDGAEVVQLYVSDLRQTVFRPEKELKGFDKVFLRAGEGKQLVFHLDFRAFAVYSPTAKAWIMPEGEYAISVAASSRDIRLQQQLTVHGRKVGHASQPAWYTDPTGRVTKADFEQLLGTRIEPVEKPGRGGYNLSSSLRDMEESLVIRLVLWIVRKAIAKRFDGVADYGNPNFRMTMDAAATMPMKALVLMSPDAMPLHVAEGLVEMANGHVFKALRSLLK